MLAALLFFGQSPAHAIGFLVSANPGIGQTLKTAPHLVTLEFSVPSIPASFSGNVIRVTNSSGKPVEMGAAKTSGMTLTVSLQESLPADVYQVAFRYVCDDGHVLVSAYNFTVAGQVEPTSAPAVSSKPAPNNSPTSAKPVPIQATVSSVPRPSKSASAASTATASIATSQDSPRETLAASEEVSAPNTNPKTSESPSFGGWIISGALLALFIAIAVAKLRRHRR